MGFWDDIGLSNPLEIGANVATGGLYGVAKGNVKAGEAIYDWAQPDKVDPNIATPDKAPVGQSSAVSMAAGQSDPTHFQPGIDMSAPLKEHANRGRARGREAQDTLTGYADQAAGYGQDASRYGAQGAAYGASGAAYGDAGAAAGVQGNRDLTDAGEFTRDYATGAAQGIQNAGSRGVRGIDQAADAQFAAGRGIATAGNNMRFRDAADLDFQNSMAASGRAQRAASQLAGLEATEGPSAAQAQLQAGSNRAMAQNLAMARAGRGFGGQASSLLQAQFANAAQQQNAANQSAQLRAAENAAWRQRQAQNLGAAAGVYGQAGQLGLATTQTQAQNEQFQRGLNQEGYLAAQGLGLDANRDAINAAIAGGSLGVDAASRAGQVGLAGHQSYQDAVGQGAGLEMQGAGLGMQGAQVGMQGAATGIAGSTAGANAASQAAGAAAAGYDLGFTGDRQAYDAIGADYNAKQAYEDMIRRDAAARAGIYQTNTAADNAFKAGIIDTATDYAAMAFGNASDIRAKKDIEYAPEAAREAVRAAPPFSYEYKDPDRHGEGTFYGGMAQDYEKTPAGRSLVHEAPDGTKMLDGGRAGLLSLAAQHGQEDELSQLKARIASLESNFGKKGKAKRRAA